MSDTERIAVEIAIHYELAQGRQVTDVGHGWPVGLGGEVRAWGRERHGFDGRPTCDLVSRDGDGQLARLVEVKGRRNSTTSVSIVDRQRNAMLGFGADWWLYVVLDVLSPSPRLVVVENPGRLSWHQVTPAPPEGSGGRVSREGKWHVGPSDVLAAGSRSPQRNARWNYTTCTTASSHGTSSSSVRTATRMRGSSRGCR